MKKQIIILICFVVSTVMQAQETGDYLYFNVGGGLHNLSYTLQNGTESGKTGYTLNLAYSHFFTPQWGIQSGIGVQSFTTITTLNLTESTPAIDSEGDSYVFRSDFRNWQENQQVVFFDIPVTGQFKYRINTKMGLLVTAGAKISIPLKATYKSTGGEIITSGFYPQWNIELTDLPQQGFKTITQPYTGKYTLNPAYTAIVELGEIYKLSEKIEVYAGAYFNYGLNNILKPETGMLYQVDGTYSGVWKSNQTSDIKPFAIGLKLGLYLKQGKK